jgi:DUF1009 family protein
LTQAISRLPSKTVALFAGRGQLPRLLIEAFKSENQSYVVLSPDATFVNENEGAYPLHIGQVQATLDLLKKHDVCEIVMAGKFDRPPLRKLRVDLLGAKWLSEILLKPKGDDFLLTFISHKLEREGFHIRSPDHFLASLVVPPGCLTRKKPSLGIEKDVEKAFKLLKSLSPFDIGQAVVVQQGWILGIEAAEGTDALIWRCGPIAFPGSEPILVKAVKTGQDTRLDLPTIGLETLQLCHRAGFEGIAFEANGVYVLDREEMIRYADENDLFLESFARESKDA